MHLCVRILRLGCARRCTQCNASSFPRSFFSMPLLFAGRCLGALIVMSPSPNALPDRLQRLLSDLGMQVAQSLYVWDCTRQLRTGEGPCVFLLLCVAVLMMLTLPLAL